MLGQFMVIFCKCFLCDWKKHPNMVKILVAISFYVYHVKLFIVLVNPLSSLIGSSSIWSNLSITEQYVKIAHSDMSNYSL